MTTDTAKNRELVGRTFTLDLIKRLKQLSETVKVQYCLILEDSEREEVVIEIKGTYPDLVTYVTDSNATSVFKKF